MEEVKQLLKEPGTEPTDKVLETLIGERIYNVYKELTGLSISQFGLTPQWRYYNDGKAWLCKVAFKEKTIFWLSLWEHYAKVSFYFTNKTCSRIYDLEISEEIKENLRKSNNTGKLIPLVLKIEEREQLKDLWTIVSYKKENIH
jgi:hypothetical protein